VHTLTRSWPRPALPWTSAAPCAGLLLLLTAGCLPSGEPAVAGFGIIGGQPTSGWPAVGAYLVGGATAGLCTGTLIDERTVLTAAHCADGWDPDRDDNFYLGSSAFAPDDRLEVLDVAIHPDYDPEQHRADLAVLVLDAIPGVQPMPRNEVLVNDAWIDTPLRVVGYGNTDTYDGETMGDKYETEVHIYDVTNDLMLHETEGHNTCAGDSGGPAMVQQDGEWVLVGVVSFVYPAAPDQDECSGGGGETRVDPYLDWMQEYMDLPPPPPLADGLPSDDEDGCQCRTGSVGSASGQAVLAVLAAWALGRRRGRAPLRRGR
jgi:secreted trypsin-like serine protease